MFFHLPSVFYDLPGGRHHLQVPWTPSVYPNWTEQFFVWLLWVFIVACMLSLAVVHGLLIMVASLAEEQLS